MCSPSKPDPAPVVVTPPPAVAPQPMAIADGEAALNLSQLKIGSKSNAKLRAPASKLTIPTAPPPVA
jgi:hypothetical protein